MSKHRGEDMKGRLKEAVGDITDDKGLQREGKVDRASAAIKARIDKVTDKIGDAVNDDK